MNSEDFFALVYPGLFISSILLSIIPAYVASRKNKNFWVWWLCTSFIFVLLLASVIAAQEISWTIYLLGILPIASILALIPGSRYERVFSPYFRVISPIKRLFSFKDSSLFLLALIAMLIVGGVLYYFLFALPNRQWTRSEMDRYYVPSAVAFLVSCFGSASFLFVISERRISYIALSIFCVAILAVPVFLEPSRADLMLEIVDILIRTNIPLGSLRAGLMSNPVVGAFVLLGICSGCVAIAIVANDKFHIAEKLGTFVSVLDELDPPYIPLPQTRILPKIFLGAIVAWALLLHFIGPSVNEGWIFFPPLWLPLLCVVGPISIFPILGFMFSSVVICLSWWQRKYLFAIGIPACGLLVAWSQLRLPLYGNSNAGITYAVTTGFISLILWVFSDYRAQY